ncbi:hypothetical protein A8C56_22960 [Niabella ginsenosidivorans]|uniref:Uncharacterized protein n=1 Tax=Niabella ginsenosidivorans TaxID=1176587 RepID=A0A1A9I763_9BACT|nr:hypothetical protein A8C56_22960 [Niabella ginsenosidivorans]
MLLPVKIHLPDKRRLTLAATANCSFFYFMEFSGYCFLITNCNMKENSLARKSLSCNPANG